MYVVNGLLYWTLDKKAFAQKAELDNLLDWISNSFWYLLGNKTEIYSVGDEIFTKKFLVQLIMKGVS